MYYFVFTSKNRITECLNFCPPKCSEKDGNIWSSGHQAVGSLLTAADLSHNSISAIRNLEKHDFLELLSLQNNMISRIEGLDSLKFLKVHSFYLDSDL